MVWMTRESFSSLFLTELEAFHCMKYQNQGWKWNMIGTFRAAGTTITRNIVNLTTKYWTATKCTSVWIADKRTRLQRQNREQKRSNLLKIIQSIIVLSLTAIFLQFSSCVLSITFCRRQQCLFILLSWKLFTVQNYTLSHYQKHLKNNRTFFTQLRRFWEESIGEVSRCFQQQFKRWRRNTFWKLWLQIRWSGTTLFVFIRKENITFQRNQ